MIGKGFFSNPKKMKDTGFILLFLAVPVANFLVFWLYVNFDSIKRSAYGIARRNERDDFFIYCVF